MKTDLHRWLLAKLSAAPTREHVEVLSDFVLQDEGTEKRYVRDPQFMTEFKGMLKNRLANLERMYEQQEGE